jgi:excinuclease UvrABC nuclease subunit
MIFYKDFVSMKRIIIEENSGKSGIYMITNIRTGVFYVGQAGDLAKRFRDYTNPAPAPLSSNVVMRGGVILQG